MAKTITTKNGKKITLRNPAEKGKRYASQLKSGIVQETGKKLKNTDRAFRFGYLKARSDNAKAYKSNLNKKTPTKRGRPTGTVKKKVINKKDTYKVTIFNGSGNKVLPTIVDGLSYEESRKLIRANSNKIVMVEGSTNKKK